jgi:hypothetical protein
MVDDGKKRRGGPPGGHGGPRKKKGHYVQSATVSCIPQTPTPSGVYCCSQTCHQHAHILLVIVIHHISSLKTCTWQLMSLCWHTGLLPRQHAPPPHTHPRTPQGGGLRSHPTPLPYCHTCVLLSAGTQYIGEGHSPWFSRPAGDV